MVTVASGKKNAAKKIRKVTDYQPLPGTADEMLGPDGKVRPVWRHFVESLARMSKEDLESRIAKADRYLRDAGVFYRAYGGAPNIERSWPLSPVPVLIDAKEWAVVSEGLVQRAELLEQIAADIYSDNLLEVTEWCMSLDPLSRPQSVFALQKELARETERRYTKLSFGERLKLGVENLTTGVKT